MISRRITVGVMVAALSCFPVRSNAQAEGNAPPNAGAENGVKPIQLPPETIGDIFMARFEYRQALDAYAQAPKTAEIWNKMGVAYHHLFAMEQAKQDYEHALSLQPNLAEALSNLGSIYFNEKDYRRAEKYYRKALKVEPQSGVVYHNLGMLYFVRGKTQKGVEALQKAFALDPGLLQRDPLESIAEPTTRQERARENFCLAELFAEHGQYDRAIEYLRKAIDEGFADRKRVTEDPAFQQLRGTREFAQLVALDKPH